MARREGVGINTTLWGSATDLELTTGFVASTGLRISNGLRRTLKEEEEEEKKKKKKKRETIN